MGTDQALSGVNEVGKTDVVKSEIGELEERKDASGTLCANNGEDGACYVGSSSNLTKVGAVLDETKSSMIVKSKNKGSADGKVASRLMCAHNCEDSVLPPSGLKKVDEVIDEEIDIINCTSSSVVKMVKDEDLDATEYSSSFGDTFSGSDSESKRDHDEMEVDSPFVHSNEDPVIMDALNSDFKKKKVSAHWRKFISPLMWRCQWLELRMKELLLQASKYDKELAAYKHEKELQSKMVELHSSVSRSVPWTSQSHWRRAMKRRKRKRNEDKADVSSYLSNHVAFSYYENKKADTDGHSVDDDCGDLEDNTKRNDDSEWLLGLKGSDSSLEQILLNIQAVQSRVIELKTHLNKVICRNAGEICSSNLFLGDPPPSYAQNVSGSPGNNRDAMPAGLLGTLAHHVSEYEMEDMVMPESASSSYGDAADVDIIESTVGLLSADVNLDQHQLRDLGKDVQNADDVLIDNQVAEEEYQNFEKVGHATEKLEGMLKTQAETHSEDESTAPNVSMPEPDPVGENVDMPQQSVLKPCYTGKKRGRKPKKKKKKKKQRGGSVAGSGPSRNERLHGSGPSRSEKVQGSGASRSEKLHVSGASRSEKLHGSVTSVPWRSERLKKRRLSGKIT